MNQLATQLLALIDETRLKDTLYELVSIPSPTGDTRAFAEHYAQLLREMGLTGVQLLETEGWENSPSVVGWRRGDAHGPTLHFDGHQDHIHQPHVAPYVKGERVYGRGSNDMKSGLAAMLELGRVLEAARVRLPGDLLFTSHDLHEAPVGYGDGVRSLIRHGYVGDAVVVTEGPSDALYVAGKGNSVFEIVLTSRGEAVHELASTPEMPNVLELGARVVAALVALRDQVSQRRDPVLGPESLFLGILQAGDFYNRLPQSCRIVGTRRFAPEVDRQDVREELLQTVTSVVGDWPVEIWIDTSKGNDGYRLSPDEPIAMALRSAYQAVAQQPLPLDVQLFGADNAKFMGWAGVPAVVHGVGLARSHADLEWCEVGDLVRVTKVLLLTVLNFYGLVQPEQI